MTQPSGGHEYCGTLDALDSALSGIASLKSQHHHNESRERIVTAVATTALDHPLESPSSRSKQLERMRAGSPSRYNTAAPRIPCERCGVVLSRARFAHFRMVVARRHLQDVCSVWAANVLRERVALQASATAPSRDPAKWPTCMHMLTTLRGHVGCTLAVVREDATGTAYKQPAPRAT